LRKQPIGAVIAAAFSLPAAAQQGVDVLHRRSRSPAADRR